MASERAKKAAAARLAKIDKEVAQEKSKVAKNKLRAKVAYGDRKTRRKAASELSGMPKKGQWKE